MMLSSNAYHLFNKKGRHRAGKRVQAKKAEYLARQQVLLERAKAAASVTDEAFPPLSPSDPVSPQSSPFSDSDVDEMIKSIEDMVDDVGGRVIWPADVMYKKLM